jgi:uncharacterized protein (TIGR03083 family)
MLRQPPLRTLWLPPDKPPGRGPGTRIEKEHDAMADPRHQQAGPAEPAPGDWPYAPELLRPELDRYLADAAGPGVDQLPTRCPSWTVRDVTVHLVCTFSRFHKLLNQGRAGDFTPPFRVEQLAAENQRAAASYRSADPCGELRRVVDGFTASLADGDELMPHQLGPIPVALQVLFGLNELAIHHDDVAAAAGRRYDPPPETLAVLLLLWRRRHGDAVTNWLAILRASGRTP